MRDLNGLIDPTDPLQPFVILREGVDINDLGQIAANGSVNRTGIFGGPYCACFAINGDRTIIETSEMAIWSSLTVALW